MTPVHFVGLVRESFGPRCGWLPFFLFLTHCAGKSEHTPESLPSFERLELSSWGSSASSPPDAPCELATAPRVLTVTASPPELSWDLCELTAPGIVQRQTGKRALAHAQVASIQDSLRKISPTDTPVCKFDYPVFTLDLWVDGDILSLADNCTWGSVEGRLLVKNIDSLAGTLYALKTGE